MKAIGALLVGSACASLVWAGTALAQGASSMSFGGRPVAVNQTSCSADNSADGKSRAIAGINMASASSTTIQFSTDAPASGDYTTVESEDDLAPGKVVVGAAGTSFGGAYLATAGQTIKVTRTGSTYRAVFTGLKVVAVPSKQTSPKALAGDLSCSV